MVSPLFDDCRHLASRIPRLHIRHTYRKANKCADRLAKLGLHQSLDFVIHTSPPMDIIASYEADCQGLFVNRLCPDSCIPVIISILPTKKKKKKSVIISI